MKIKITCTDTYNIDVLYSDMPLKRLQTLKYKKAKKIFKALDISKVNEYKYSTQVFFQFHVYSLSTGVNEIEITNLEIDDGDFIYIHLQDKIMPVGIILCKSDNGNYLGSYITGLSMKEKIKLGESNPINKELPKSQRQNSSVRAVFGLILALLSVLFIIIAIKGYFFPDAKDIAKPKQLELSVMIFFVVLFSFLLFISIRMIRKSKVTMIAKSDKNMVEESCKIIQQPELTDSTVLTSKAIEIDNKKEDQKMKYKCRSCGAQQAAGAWEKAMDDKAKAAGKSGFYNINEKPECIKCGSLNLIDLEDTKSQDSDNIYNMTERNELIEACKQFDKAKLQYQKDISAFDGMEIARAQIRKIGEKIGDIGDKQMMIKVGESLDNPYWRSLVNSCWDGIHGWMS